jgi:hypothetical protein
MKKVKVAAALVLSALSMSTFAGTATQTVNVGATLTSVCKLKVAGAVALNFTYTAFTGSAVAATPVTTTFECTRGYGSAPTVSWDGATAIGTVKGLQYTLSTSVTTTAGTAADTTTTGTATEYAYQIDGSMPAGQAGDASASATAARTMTITF